MPQKEKRAGKNADVTSHAEHTLFFHMLAPSRFQKAKKEKKRKLPKILHEFKFETAVDKPQRVTIQVACLCFFSLMNERERYLLLIRLLTQKCLMFT